ncbi:hypothetical protein TREAZ_1449 [Leadbettera azotonutricia ZAS-9]|uniref:Uncharacterized protein n=1 Tax=Leadbettera azotonutricia (strain ATCC BAA-888 / DSM 13862 / ZAS-9) TaxID=545695 RepID=F5YER2_LEAAZ|nr:hypothetical protein TREAZ_1449 [Leadbettera azotonutricia ZAS-9]
MAEYEAQRCAQENAGQIEKVPCGDEMIKFHKCLSICSLYN